LADRILAIRLMRAPPSFAHTQGMSDEPVFDLQAYSQALTKLIGRAGEHVVAVAAAAYRVSSGVVFRDGLIAVNSHALRREGKIPVTLPDGSETQAAIIGREPSVDTAILQIERGRVAAAIPVREDDPQALEAGALAVVVGRTLDAGLSASVGILGAVGGPRRTWRGGTLSRFLRLDVNLYPSQAGAAVISPAGKLIGMATGAMSRHSALAIPVDTLDRIADELLKEGRIRRGYLGVGLQPVSIPEHLRSKSPLVGEIGLMVLSVEPGAGAEEAGIQLGDILVACGGKSIGDTEGLQDLLRSAVGTKLKLTLLRAGQLIEPDVPVAERQPGRA
jgi:S1-C subfamily serine protease